MNIIETDRLRYAYGTQDEKWVLDGIDLAVAADDYLLVCGASGSGKSTLGRTFNGLIPHFYGGRLEGKVYVKGQATNFLAVSDLFATVGMVFQNPQAQLFNRTVKREIAFGLESLGLPRREIKTRLQKAASDLAVTTLLDRQPQQLSGGEKQLVAIAAILALKPKVMVLDEPYANLDPTNGRRVRQMLAAIHRQGTGVVVCEHRLVHTAADAGRMVVLHGGRIVAAGPPEAVFAIDVSVWGLETPPAVAVSRWLQVAPLKLKIDHLGTIRPEAGVIENLCPTSPAPSPLDAPLALSVSGLCSRTRNGCALHNIGFEVHAGECLAIVGANGAGKTTLAKHLNGLLRPSAGYILVDGMDTRHHKVSQLARHVGMVFQNPNDQFFKLTVRQEIEVGPRTLGCFDAAWIDQLTALFKLGPLLPQPPYRLSGGEKKRVAFAAALAAKPGLLVLDEPTAGQDGNFRRALGELLSDLRAQGQAVVMITHDLSFAERHAQRFMVMATGKVLAQGVPDQIMADDALMAAAGLEPTDGFKLRKLAKR